jgi:hypothetical protein
LLVLTSVAAGNTARSAIHKPAIVRRPRFCFHHDEDEEDDEEPLLPLLPLLPPLCGEYEKREDDVQYVG